jgi:hypothetical protein
MTKAKQKQTEIKVSRSAKCEPVTVRNSDATDPAEQEKMIGEIAKNVERMTGTKTYEMAARILEQIANTILPPKATVFTKLMRSLDAIEEMQPKSYTEAMLSTQMIATHEAAMKFMNRAVADDLGAQENRDANVTRATRLMRLHLDQIEAMQKLKGKTSEQKVTVEHVHVHAGGQAIVGAIEGPRGGGK